SLLAHPTPHHSAALAPNYPEFPGRIIIVPELPEVESLASDLRDRAVRRVIDRADIAEFSVLKTYDPPLTALHGGTLEDVTRHGKFLDLTVCVPGAASGKLHLITHLARGGWLRWREEMPAAPTRPGKGPLAFR